MYKDEVFLGLIFIMLALCCLWLRLNLAKLWEKLSATITKFKEIRQVVRGKNMKFHTPKSFIKHGLKEKSTYIGIAILCGWFFFKDIHDLIHNILVNPMLANSLVRGANTFLDKIVDVLATIAGGAIIAWYSSRNKKKDKFNCPEKSDSSEKPNS